MTKRRFWWAVLGLAVVLIAWFAVKDYFTSEEDRVRSVIEGLIANLESNHLVWAMTRIDDRLSDEYTHTGAGLRAPIDKRTVLGYLTNLKSRLEDFEVSYDEIKITVTGDRAEADITGCVTAAPKGQPAARCEVMTRPGNRQRAIIELRKEDGAWMVIKSTHVEGTWQDTPEE